MRNDIEDAWSALRECLAARSRALQDEVRSYPTPIARCDEQLPQVIAERDAAVGRLRRASDLESARATVGRDEWLGRLREFAAALELESADAAAGPRARLLAALER